MLKKMPVLLIGLIVFVFIFGMYIPTEIKSFMYSISLTIKSLIIFFLPFVIFGLLYKTTVELSQKASGILGLIFTGVVCSSIIALLLSNIIGTYIYGFDYTLALPQEENALKQMWNFSIKPICSNNVAMVSGIVSGLVFPMINKARANSIAESVRKIVSIILTGVSFFIPLFVIGFILKLQHDGSIALIVKNYLGIFLIISLSLLSYILAVYLLLNRGSVSEALRNIKNILPAAIAGFSTMSSAAAMPLTIEAAAENAQNKDLARSVIPATVNIHLVGDCFATPIFAYAILKSFGIAEPSFIAFLIFAAYFVVAKFSIAAIPGGGIIVMLPVLESNFGFNAEMLSLITALYILFDPVITCANVTGNGAFALFVDRFSGKRFKEVL